MAPETRAALWSGDVTHDEVRPLLPRYAAGELDMSEAAPVLDHLAAGCPECLNDVFSRPVGLPREPEPVAAPPPAPAPPTWQVAATIAGMLALGVAVVGVRAYRALGALSAAASAELARTTAQVTALESERARLFARLETTARHLEDARAERPPPPLAPARAEEPAPAAKETPPVEYRDDRLTVRVPNVPTAQVLAALARQSGASIRGTPMAEHAAATTFADVPLREALHRLLGAQNFALFYDDRGRLSVVDLLGAPPPPAVAATPPPEAPAPRFAPTPAALLGLLDRHPSVPIGEHLAQALGGDSLSLRQLLDTGVHHEDAAVRGEAQRAALDAVEADGELLAALRDVATGTDERTLGELVRGFAGERADELLMYVARRARDGELRVRAAGLLQQIRMQARNANN